MSIFCIGFSTISDNWIEESLSFGEEPTISANVFISSKLIEGSMVTVSELALPPPCE